MRKLILLSVLFIVFNLLWGILWLPLWKLQLLTLCIIMMLSLIYLGGNQLLKQLKILLPFVGTLIFIYTIFIILGISPEGENALAYWLAYGLPRILLLLSSILLLRIFVSWMRIEDFYNSGLSIHRLKYIILGRILYQAAFHSYPLIKDWLALIPSEQGGKRSFKQRYNFALTASLALALYVLGEADMKGEMMDNRIAICYEEQQ